MKKHSLASSIFFIIAAVVITGSGGQENQLIDLRGQWGFAIDSSDVGLNDKWYEQDFSDSIRLPGSMIESGKGYVPRLDTQWTGSIYDSSWFFNPRLEKYRQPGNLKFPFWLTPNTWYVGAAWYQKKVDIPASWSGKRIVLYLERPHWETTVWVDGVEIGRQNSLSTPHEYFISGSLAAGPHTVSIRVDNRIKEINVGPDSHSITDHTQGNWNGIVGDIYLKALPEVFLGDIKLFPDIQSKSVNVVIQVGNSAQSVASGHIELSAKSFNTPVEQKVPVLRKDFDIQNGTALLEVAYPLGSDVQLWDEFHPALYSLTVVLTDNLGNRDTRQVQLGMREFKAAGTRFEVNGKPTFLRGTVDCCVFPLTGYPSTDVASWERIFSKCRAFGLNHIRFHSWCPPEAAFTAADKVGMYLQVEGPSWANHGVTLGDGKPIDRYIYEESERIVNAYGNHPSFCLMAYGNEPAGRNQVKYLGEFVSFWKAKDNRRLYTGASIGMHWPLVPESEYIVRSGPRGLPWDQPPDGAFDYRSRIADSTVPYLAHEMGQYCVFPNFKEIAKYTGAYRARNFEMFQEDLSDHYMGNQAKDFLMASGKLQALCYKAEIEAALRTPGLAGFQLLSLDDFPGQGTALVGVLDAFWDEKGYINADEFKRFCNHTVPLARIKNFVYTNNENFHAEIEVAHFGSEPLQNVTPMWKMTSDDGVVFAEGTLPTMDTISVGSNLSLGSIDQPLAAITSATRLRLEVAVGDYANDWSIWVYPAVLPDAATDDIYFCSELDSAAEDVLKNGGVVFLHVAGKVENGKDVVQYFTPVFWNTSWFQMRPPHTTGILVDPRHPAFRHFPTEYHSNLQWWDVLNRQQVMNLELFPPEFRPLVQPIDTWFLNRRLALLFEAKVGNGRLMVCSADLESRLDERPAARQLLYSLTEYMASAAFEPKYQVELSTAKELFEKKEREGIDFHTKDSPEDLQPKTQ